MCCIYSTWCPGAQQRLNEAHSTGTLVFPESHTMYVLSGIGGHYCCTVVSDRPNQLYEPRCNVPGTNTFETEGGSIKHVKLKNQHMRYHIDMRYHLEVSTP